MTEDLHDEQAFDPKHLFDEKKFSTIFVNREGFTSKQNDTAARIVQLLQPGITRPESEEIFKHLSGARAQSLLVEAIGSAASESDKKILTAACWESGLDFSPSFPFFADLVINSGFDIALEAFTVIQEMENPPAAEMGRALARISSGGEPANAMVNELKDLLQSKLHPK
jgi:hypothetical protein